MGHNDQLLLASKRGAARELFEETGIDVQKSLDRVQPLALTQEMSSGPRNEYKHRLFYVLKVTDSDFSSTGGVHPMDNMGSHLKVRDLFV